MKQTVYYLKLKRKVLAVFFLIVIFASLNISHTKSMSNEVYSPIELNAPPFFEIDSDDDFVSYGFPGSGNLTDPYIIENYTISGPYSYAIEITYTTKHFIIRNCNFSDISIF